MIRRALFFVLLAVMGPAGEALAALDELEVWVDVDGTAYLHNTTADPIAFDGYQIVSETGGLDVAGWNSIQDQIPTNAAGIIGSLGAGALGFGEAAPTETQLAELNLAGGGTLQAGAKFAIGKPFGQGGYAVVTWFNLAIGMEGIAGGLLLPRFPLPEPSTWLLATLAALGCVAIRRRR